MSLSLSQRSFIGGTVSSWTAYLFFGDARFETKPCLDPIQLEVVWRNVEGWEEVGLGLAMADTPPSRYLPSMHMARNGWGFSSHI